MSNVSANRQQLFGRAKFRYDPHSTVSKHCRMAAVLGAGYHSAPPSNRGNVIAEIEQGGHFTLRRSLHPRGRQVAASGVPCISAISSTLLSGWLSSQHTHTRSSSARRAPPPAPPPVAPATAGTSLARRFTSESSRGVSSPPIDRPSFGKKRRRPFYLAPFDCCVGACRQPGRAPRVRRRALFSFGAPSEPACSTFHETNFSGSAP